MAEDNTIVYQNEAEGLNSQNMKTMQKKQRLRFLLLTLVVVGVIGYLIFSGMQDTMGYYLTVSEITEQRAQMADEHVRVSGNVAEGSVSWDPGEQRLQFTILDETSEKTGMPVVYKGLVPDSFKQGQKVIVAGVYAEGVFTANELLTTCASKYE